MTVLPTITNLKTGSFGSSEKEGCIEQAKGIERMVEE